MWEILQILLFTFYFLLLPAIISKAFINHSQREHMSALDKLKEKIEAWKTKIDELEQENTDLKSQLEQAGENGELAEKLAECEQSVESLKSEIAEKDQEIEEIIEKVEMLLE
jgi:flagellar biosynthesis chaperone FliJ